MAKTRKTRLRIVRGEMEILKLVLIELRDEILVKPSGNGADVHWAYVHALEAAETHVTHEKYQDGRRHRQVRPLQRDQLVRVVTTIFSQPGAPPPKFGSLSSRRERDKLERWLKRTLPKVFHPPTDAPIRVLRDGPVKEFFKSCLTVGNGGDIDIDSILRSQRVSGKVVKEDRYKIIREDEMTADGSVFGLKNDPSRTVFAFKDGIVMEVHDSSFEASGILKEGQLGLEGFVRTLKRKRVLPKGVASSRCLS